MQRIKLILGISGDSIFLIAPDISAGYILGVSKNRVLRICSSTNPIVKIRKIIIDDRDIEVVGYTKNR